MSESVYCGCLEQPYNHNDWRYNQIKEELCFTYLSTICAFLGATLERKTRPMDNAGVDATIELPPNGTRKSPLRIDVQLKGTSVPRFDDLNKSIVFSLKKDLYNIMCSPRTTPWLLMILVLPIEVERWVVVTDEDLISSGTMIWCDASSSEAMVGDSEVKIRIPTTNKVTEQWLHHALFSQLEMMQ